MAEKILVSWLHHALHHLYDPAELSHSPLMRILADEQVGGPLALRRLLIDAIEDLRPGPDLSPESGAWRSYQALSSRFVKQFSQNSVALALNLSVRQIRRQEALALEELANYLSERHEHLLQSPDEGDAGRNEAAPQVALDPAGGNGPQARDVPRELAGLPEVLASVLETTAPLALVHSVQLVQSSLNDLSGLAVNRAAVRQCLLGVLAHALPLVAGGQVRVCVQAHGPVVSLQLDLLPPGADNLALDEARVEVLARLAEMAGAKLEVVTSPAGNLQTIQISVPCTVQTPVLVIDDNGDALRLLERYLTGSRYQLIGTQDPQEVLPLALSVAPSTILLDVMLPGIDGWELLGRLRAHPETSTIPVIMCSVLPQEQLALALGARAFLRKPLMAESVLAMLDRLNG